MEEEKEARALNLNAEKEEKMYSLRSALPAYKAYPILVRRAYRNLLRDPQAALTRFTQVPARARVSRVVYAVVRVPLTWLGRWWCVLQQVMAFAVIMTICFLRIDNDQTGVQNKLGFLYEVLSLLFVGQLNAIAMCTSSPRRSIETQRALPSHSPWLTNACSPGRAQCVLPRTHRRALRHNNVHALLHVH